MPVLKQEQIAETVESLRDSTEWFHCDCGIKMKAADMLEQLAADNARVKEMRDQIVGDKINLRGELATMQVEVELLRKLLESWLELSNHCSIEEGVCCCGDSMGNHSKAMDCGHMPLDHGTYIAGILEEKTRAALQEKPHD